MNHKVVSALPKVKLPTSFCNPLPWCDGRCVQGPGTYSPWHSDPRLLAIPTSWSRVADSIRTTTHFMRSACSREVASLCMRHCSTCVATGRKGHDDLTSSPPSSSLSLAVSFEFPAGPLATKDKGLRSLRDLTQHFTTRADDSHAAPVSRFPKAHSHL